MAKKRRRKPTPAQAVFVDGMLDVIAKLPPAAKYVRIEYSGSGDEGSVDRPVVADGDDNPLEVASDLEDDIYAAASNYIDAAYDGWDDNDGGYGHIVVTILSGGARVVAEHNENYTAQNTTNDRFTVPKKAEEADGPPA